MWGSFDHGTRPKFFEFHDWGLLSHPQVYRAVKYYYIVESRTVWPNLWRVVNLIHILLILAHWFGCFYFLLSEAEGFQVKSPNLIIAFGRNCIRPFGMWEKPPVMNINSWIIARCVGTLMTKSFFNIPDVRPCTWTVASTCIYFSRSSIFGTQGDWVYPFRPGDYATLSRKYLGSLYWSTLTLTTIGDLPTPETNAE